MQRNSNSQQTDTDTDTRARIFHVFLSALAALTLHGASMPNAFGQAAEFQEYNRNPGLKTVNILFPWGAGASGRGVTVALVDTGVFTGHEDLRGSVLNGVDFVDGDGSADIASGNSHGTFIAGIIAGRRDGQGIVGVAYDSKILPVRVSDEMNKSTQIDIAKGVRFAADQRAQIINLAIARGAPNNSIVTDALIEAAGKGKAIVMPAGNNGSPGVLFPALTASQLDGMGIIAGAATANGQLWGDSNRAGSNSQHYIVAPGASILSTNNEGGHTNHPGGTSWATGYVSGGLALLLGAFPNLSARDAIEILKISARDLGEPGVDSTYGWGLMDLQAAMAPEGELRLPGGGGDGGSSSSGAAVLVVALAVGAGVAWYRTRDKKDLKQAIILDGYDRGYTADISGMITPKEDNSLSAMMQSLRQTRSGIDWIDETDSSLGLSGAIQSSFSWATDSVEQAIQSRQLISIDEFDRPEASWQMSVSGDAGNGIRWQLARNDATGNGFGLASDSNWNASSLRNSDVFTGAYLGFAGTSDITRLGFKPNTLFDLSFGFMSADEDTAYGRASDTLVFDAAFDVSEKARLNLQVSQLTEHGSLFGGASNGPLSPKSSSTVAMGISGRYRLSNRWTLMGALSHGRTAVVEDPNSMLGNFSTINSETWGLGVVAESLFVESDNLGFAITRPLKVTRGEATLNVPTSIDRNNSVLTSSEAWNLAPSGSETDVEVFYRRNFGNSNAVGAHLLYQNDPFHEDAIDDRVSFLATWRRKF